MADSVAERIIAVMAENLQMAAAGITPATVFDDLEFDSLVLVELAVILQREFGVEVSDDELAESKTVGKAAALVNERIAAA
ncbi:acyl carrier protein [Actinoallomurus purpureus]|uniref:acyl carrier protein n=1 Tax=Actinoallomurus purpureus TaxID=478114 RepID=UPI002092848A|nr:acyl carrier protein [Actinoallomurus purpureus]MCO6004070.1 acyl carrier protein [Actinoallomurus purpureus]